MVVKVSEQIYSQLNATTNKAWDDFFYNAKSYGLTGDGTTNDYTALYNLINTTIAGVNATIGFPKGTYKISSNITIPSNITIMLLEGAKLSPDAGVTLTINGSIDAGLYQIFTGSGTIAGSSKIDKCYPQWWGAKSDGITNDTSAIQNALNFSSNNCICHIPKGTYIVNGIIIPSNSIIIIHGMIKLANGANDQLFHKEKPL